eukprot:TRINITY_DN223_c0_g1_i2.p1 TRINITY_DN223_c0_g1~~TRINITY_DN223_c0_g1_i2.p1  ORF type:complete len:357 (-),score=16.14 TRINITY_DN223_c0_g1_i2:87-1157(-)
MCGIKDEDMPYLVFVHVLAASREKLSLELKKDRFGHVEPEFKEENITDRVKFRQEVFDYTKNGPLTLRLEEEGLSYSKITRIIGNINIDGIKKVNLNEVFSIGKFRSCACFCLCSLNNRPILNGKEGWNFKQFVNSGKSMNDTRQELKRVLSNCRNRSVLQVYENGELGIIDQTARNIEFIVNRIEELSPKRLGSLVDLLYTLNSIALKQRENRSCKMKASNMKTILTAAPELLKLPQFLGLEAKDSKDLNCIYDEYMDHLLKQCFSSDPTSNLITGVLPQEDHPHFDASSKNLENEHSYNVGNDNTNVARPNQEMKVTSLGVEEQELLDQRAIANDIEETRNYMDHSISNNNNLS